VALVVSHLQVFLQTITFLEHSKLNFFEFGSLEGCIQKFDTSLHFVIVRLLNYLTGYVRFNEAIFDLSDFLLRWVNQNFIPIILVATFYVLDLRTIFLD